MEWVLQSARVEVGVKLVRHFRAISQGGNVMFKTVLTDFTLSDSWWKNRRLKLMQQNQRYRLFSVQHIFLPCQALVPRFPQCNSTGDSSNWDIRCVILAGLMSLVDLVELPFNRLVCYSNGKIIAGFSITGRSVKTRWYTRFGRVLTAKWLNRFIICISCCRVQAKGV